MGIKVLVVDSDRNCLQATSDVLRERYEDATIYQATDGESAITFLTEMGDHVDAVLLGTDMPVTNGWEALYIIKDTDNWPGVPVVMMVTEDKLWEDSLKAHTIGADHFVSKPISAAELTNVLNDLFLEPA